MKFKSSSYFEKGLFSYFQTGLQTHSSQLPIPLNFGPTANFRVVVQQGSKYRTAGRRSWWPAKYFLAWTNPDFGQSNKEYYIIFFCLWSIELRWKMVKNSFTCSWVPFHGFRPFSCPLYLEYHGGVWIPKVHPISAYRLTDMWSKVSSTKKNNAKYFR